jgi:hypothetical protein
MLNHGNVDCEIDERLPTIHLSKIDLTPSPAIAWLGFFIFPLQGKARGFPRVGIEMSRGILSCFQARPAPMSCSFSDLALIDRTETIAIVPPPLESGRAEILSAHRGPVEWKRLIGLDLRLNEYDR